MWIGVEALPKILQKDVFHVWSTNVESKNGYDILDVADIYFWNISKLRIPMEKMKKKSSKA